MWKNFILGGLLLTSFGASAECWVVKNLTGQSQFSPEYKSQPDKAVGIYFVSINKNSATLSSANNIYDSGLNYFPTSPLSMIGVASSGRGAFIETWAITTDKKAIYTKVRIIEGNYNQLSSFIGNVTGKC
ncbi:hypothetical protein FNH73_15485 [Salmonella enterica subsp. salamae]|nr:hypothetical protein [Salmonella enterica subsp. salamae]